MDEDYGTVGWGNFQQAGAYSGSDKSDRVIFRYMESIGFPYIFDLELVKTNRRSRKLIKRDMRG